MSIFAVYGTRVPVAPSPLAGSASSKEAPRIAGGESISGGGMGSTVECSSRRNKKATARHIETRPRKSQAWDIRRKPTVYAFLPPLPPDWTRASSGGGDDASGHLSFIKDVAATEPPKRLHHLLKVLHARGETIVSPGSRQGLIPLVIPLAQNLSGGVIGLLRWPTAPPGMEMPIVEVRKHGVWLLAKNVDQYIHRILVEEDANSQNGSDELYRASSEAGKELYNKGDFAKSQIKNLEVYLLKEVGMFPDVLERKVTRHFDEGDEVSAMVTGEFYTKKDLFPGFGRPFAFYAEILLRVGRASEAKDAARVALKSPWWTLGCTYEEVAQIAQWEDEQIEYIKEKVSEEGKEEDIKKGKAPAQVSLDEAAFLLDLASIEGTWSDYLERIAECYKEAGFDDIAKFVLYRD
ncbi:protein IN CHLOROPLAST ATPASE BIOGENESIS, chloroplastic [Rhodamnia argentea]|uniref:Protein IN CHLOROPLAST ATPASE BIOGENESIS, chloroplastic n=1 Tax=Rhodamnia argentea TaxID=178133 RepID=A0A8B8QYG8_9MYRT|nr:protein IN CHLOROPLAST ATPASE BIOGENESIS, chloroplastic [Rhodamnia argentea]